MKSRLDNYRGYLIMERLILMSPSVCKFVASGYGRHKALVIALLAVMACLLSSCAVLHGSASGTTFLAASQRHVNFGMGFENADVQSVAYRNPSEYEEYDRWTGAGQAEVIFAVANGPDTALQFSDYRLPAMTKSWTFNENDAQLDLKPTHVLHDRQWPFTYALYPHQAAGDRRDCVAFLRSWDNPPDDPMHRPGKALFGYYCAPSGQSLSERQAIAVLRGIVVDANKIPQVYFGQDLPDDPRALRRARGSDSSHRGNPEFPFYFSRHYNVGNDALH
ncbi:MAG: hypothetical protein PF501_11300 [Salinisphaera sp.]|nr:hypothetical protein [Salinisphaera sp.]